MLKALFFLRNTIKMTPSPFTFKKTWPLGLILPATGLLYFVLRRPIHVETVYEEANGYMPVQSDSEKAAGHPIVGSY